MRITNPGTGSPAQYRTVELGKKELFGRPTIVPQCKKFFILMKGMANGHRKWFLNTNLFLIKPFLIAKCENNYYLHRARLWDPRVADNNGL